MGVFWAGVVLRFERMIGRMRGRGACLGMRRRLVAGWMAGPVGFVVWYVPRWVWRMRADRTLWGTGRGAC